MKAYKTHSMITDAHQVVLSDVPFDSGEKVEIVIRPTNGERSEAVRDLGTLFKTTQSLPQIQALTEEDILREIEAYRKGK
jgi:hypothetical protein